MRFAINGARGRMGRMITDIVAGSDGHSIAALVEAPGHPDVDLEVDAGGGVVVVTDRVDDIPADVDVGLDFSAPGCGVDFAAAMASRGAALLVGTTGLSGEDMDHLRSVAQRVPVLVASNTSLGVFCLTELTLAARRILGDSYDVEIVEMHHRHKKDSPSGTALSLAGALAKTGLKPAFDRNGQRANDEVGLASVRGGEVVGTHTVYFLGAHDQIEICHRAGSREALAQGAIRLATALRAYAPGWYGAADLLRS